MRILHDELDQTMALTVWGSHSPVIVRVEEADRLMNVSIRVGKPLPLLSSAAGLLFAAYLPRAIIDPIIRAEVQDNKIARGDNLIRSMAEAERLIMEAKSRGIARISGNITPGIAALASPVFDHRGYPATVISAIGLAGSFDESWTGTVAAALRQRTSQISRKLGHMGGSHLRQHPAQQPAGERPSSRARPGRRSANI
jgi:DNA-binding IclR family transcriptional regulator